MEEDRRPIGYWLKQVDRLIDTAFDRTLGSDGLTRRHWQILNTLAAGSATAAALAQAVRPFVGNDTSSVAAVIDDLHTRGWVRNVQDGNVQLSEQGSVVHARVAERVSAIRELLRSGITDDEYVTVVRVLERMASNLESQTGEMRAND